MSRCPSRNFRGFHKALFRCRAIMTQYAKLSFQKSGKLSLAPWSVITSTYWLQVRVLESGPRMGIATIYNGKLVENSCRGIGIFCRLNDGSFGTTSHSSVNVIFQTLPIISSSHSVVHTCFFSVQPMLNKSSDIIDGHEEKWEGLSVLCSRPVQYESRTHHCWNSTWRRTLRL